MSTDTFATTIEPHRGALRVHCYRMLGSSHDSDDMVQETLLRAWRARETLHDPTRVRPWLYRIATNVCLDELARRPRRALASDLGPPTDDAQPPYDAPLAEALWLEPMPDRWLADVAPDPQARYALRESVALAFVAALQVLSPAQRATLLLRDVIGLSADEAAAALDQSVASINSALHRARVAIDEKVGPRDPASFASTETETDAVLARYVRALAESDVDAMLALIHDDMHTTMPPVPTWIAGKAANAQFYRAMFARFPVGDVVAVPLGANGQPGFAFYRGGQLRAIEVVEVRDDRIWRMHHFMTPALFPMFAPA
ncbi:MAG: RNA polymerase subunit sigma-70 [Deltaproteobacteria bacterium]|nr:RNA polymerase subunit sigma-70 [Deltaproteobacteria bacterium]